jgi:DNA-binding transcriptional MerR regulator
VDGYTISQVAERAGFPATTLRYYEQAGLVRPARSEAGYRLYDDSHVERLAFIGRAKGLGFSLDEITELLVLLDEDDCGPVQDRLFSLVTAGIEDARRRVAELVAFGAELHRAAAALHGHTPDGPCDDTCGCIADAAATAGGRAGVPPVEAAGPQREPIVCTLDAELVSDRIEAWHAALASATTREPLADGIRVRFSHVDPAALFELAAAEHDCCRFLRFAVSIDTNGVALDITGPPEAQPLITALAGAAC